MSYEKYQLPYMFKKKVNVSKSLECFDFDFKHFNEALRLALNLSVSQAELYKADQNQSEELMKNREVLRNFLLDKNKKLDLTRLSNLKAILDVQRKNKINIYDYNNAWNSIYDLLLNEKN